jgi:hypothetical protein
MSKDFAAAMRRATLAARASNVAEATRVIQDALSGPTIPGAQDRTVSDIYSPPAQSRPKPFVIDPDADVVEPAEASPKASDRVEIPPLSTRMRKSLGETLIILRNGRFSTDALATLPACAWRD